MTRQVSAFCVSTNPRLFLVDTPGIMVPRVDATSVGLRLALVRAVPDNVVPPDVLVGYMLRLVRARMRRLSRRRRASRRPSGDPGMRGSSTEGRDAPGAIEAWLQGARADGGRGDEPGQEDDWRDDVEVLLRAVERASGAEGKSEPAARRRICCDYVLQAFRDGRFGRMTLDEVLV